MNKFFLNIYQRLPPAATSCKYLPANDDCLVAFPLEGSDHGSADKASAAADKHPTPGGPHHDLCSSGSTLKT